MHGSSLICAEGRLWEGQRRFVNAYMKRNGMSTVTITSGKKDSG